MSFNKFLGSFKFPRFTISESVKETTYVYFMYVYGGAIGLATIYGIKKGTQKWYEWKQKRSYRKISIDSIESVVNIACDGGAWAYYIIACAAANAMVAATSPVSVPVILYFLEEPKNKTINETPQVETNTDDESVDEN